MVTTTTDQAENRRIHRVPLSLPIRVASYISPQTTWDEITRLNDVSAFGAGFNLKRPIKRGRLIEMTIPLPRQLRCFDFSEPQYRIWGIVRRCIPINFNTLAERYAIGVAFIGKYPPNNYHNEPTKIYEISQREEKGLWQIIPAPTKPDESKLQKEERRHSRYSLPVNVTLETLDEKKNVTASEMGVTENLSLSGAAVFSSLPAEVGSFIRLKCDQYSVSIISIVRGKRMGVDGIPRLHLEFIDRLFPLEGIE